MSARGLARIIGQCITMTNAIVPAKLLLRSAYHILASRDNWESLVSISKEARRDLEWSLRAIQSWNRVPLTAEKTIDVQIETDTSCSGLRGVLDKKEATGFCSRLVSYQYSNFKELLAIYNTLLTFGDEIAGKHVQILTDNITCVAYINRFGGPSKKLSTLMTTIWTYCQSLGISLCAKHLAGKMSFRADQLS